MASKTEICNLAISHLGHGKEISNVDTENSSEATICRRYYETALRAILRDAKFTFATKNVALGLVGSNPTTEWNYSYRYPSDCIFFRRIWSGSRNDTNDTRVEYKIIRDDTGLLIYTDMENAVAEYTFYNDDEGQYPPDFVMALSYRLANLIAPSITKGDPFGMGAKAYEMYLMEITRAQASSYNEEQPAPEQYSELERSR
jgi:hypothetical protein